MSIIYIKGTYAPLGDAQIRVYKNSPNSISYAGNQVQFSFDSGIITAIKSVEITDEEFLYVQDREKKIARNEIFENYLIEQYKSVQTLLKYIKVFDAIYPLHEELHMQTTYEWSIDNMAWLPVPDKRITAWRGKGLISTLPDNFLANIELLANQQIPILFGFTHLHKAYQDENPRYKWINATTAAEHAFKQFLTLLDPKSHTLMTYIPSPPLEKLYKSVLFDYTGKESSMYRELQKGAAKRNDLIHKPATPAPTLKETNIYLHQVEVAIFELYTLLYPNNSFFEYSLKRAFDRLEHVKKGGSYHQ